MIVFRALAFVLALLPVLSGQAAADQNYVNGMKDAFDGLYAPGQQYAVAGLNFTPVANFLPQPLVANGPAAAQRNNYLSYPGANAPNHSEALIMGQFENFRLDYVHINAAQVTALSMYSRNIPCAGCTGIMAPFRAHYPTIAPELGYFQQWVHATDGQNYPSLITLVAAGWSVYRTCGTGVNNCWTFQRRFRVCLVQTPVVCQHCLNRVAGITGFINDFFTEAYRAAAAWGNVVDAHVGPIDHAAVKAAFVNCAGQAAQYPVGPRL